MRACTSEAVFTTVVDGGRTTVGRKVTGAAVAFFVVAFFAVAFFAVAFFAVAFFAVAFFAVAFFAVAVRAGAFWERGTDFFVDFVFFAGAMGRTLEQSRVC
jgi:hypothetical protein